MEGDPGGSTGFCVIFFFTLLGQAILFCLMTHIMMRSCVHSCPSAMGARIQTQAVLLADMWAGGHLDRGWVLTGSALHNGQTRDWIFLKALGGL